MHRWERSHGRIGVNAPSWLTFEVHRPFFDGAESPLAALHARAPVVAQRLYLAGDPQAPRSPMVMPARYRRQLVEDSRLYEYEVRWPTHLATELASSGWAVLAQAYQHHHELADAERAGLVQWLVAACLPYAVVEVAPTDLSASACAAALPALVQYARATALLQIGGFTERTAAAFAPLVSAPVATVAHVQATAAWGCLLARHAEDGADPASHASTASKLLDELDPELTPFHRAIFRAWLLLCETTHAEMHGDLSTSWDFLRQARSELPGTSPTADEQIVVDQLRLCVIDRQVQVAVKGQDYDGETAAVSEGLALDPHGVRVRLRQAQAAQRRGQLGRALRAYLLAARLGPFGTAHALLRAAGCAASLGHDEPARVLYERAFRVAPRSAATLAALDAACRAAGDDALAGVVRHAAPSPNTPVYAGNWHYQMYGAYFNLGTSRSPSFHANLPRVAYELAVAGEFSRLDVQRVMPPGFRASLVGESGLNGFAVRHPGGLAAALRTPEWERLCEWVADFAQHDLHRRLLTCRVLHRLGFRTLIEVLVPSRPMSSLTEPLEFYLYRLRDLGHRADSAVRIGPTLPVDSLEMVDNPHCPLHIRLCASTFGVALAARETHSLGDATRWLSRAQEYLDDMLASDEFTPFEKAMLQSRFHREVGFVPFMTGDRAGTVAAMDRAEQLARAVPTSSVWEELLKRDNLHACLRSRSREAFGLGDVPLGQRRVEELLALDPHDPAGHVEMAECLSRQERCRQAADSYLRAARLGPPGTAIAYSMAGECLDRAGEATLAEDCFVQALRVDPHAVSAAHGWRRVSSNGMGALASEYAQQLERR